MIDGIEAIFEAAVSGAATNWVTKAGNAAWSKFRHLLGEIPRYRDVAEAVDIFQQEPSEIKRSELMELITAIGEHDQRLIEAARDVINVTNNIDLREAEISTQTATATHGVATTQGSNSTLNQTINQYITTEFPPDEVAEARRTVEHAPQSSDELDVVPLRSTVEIGKDGAIAFLLHSRSKSSRDLRLILDPSDPDVLLRDLKRVRLEPNQTVPAGFSLPNVISSFAMVKASGNRQRSVEYEIHEHQKLIRQGKIDLLVPSYLGWVVSATRHHAADGFGGTVNLRFQNIGNDDISTIVEIRKRFKGPSGTIELQPEVYRINAAWRGHNELLIKLPSTDSFRQQRAGGQWIIDIQSNNRLLKPFSWAFEVRSSSKSWFVPIAAALLLIIGAIYFTHKSDDQPAAAQTSTTAAQQRGAATTPFDQCPSPQQFEAHAKEPSFNASVVPSGTSKAMLLFQIGSPELDSPAQAVVAICRTNNDERYYFIRHIDNPGRGALANAQLVDGGYIAKAGDSNETTYTIQNGLFNQKIGVVTDDKNGSANWPLVCVDTRIENSTVTAASAVQPCQLTATPTDWG